MFIGWFSIFGRVCPFYQCGGVKWFQSGWMIMTLFVGGTIDGLLALRSLKL
jgi:hypothetical protein